MACNADSGSVTKTHHPIILIPARMASTRLPGKPMAMIGSDPMIVHVWRRAMEANAGPVVVACDAPEVEQAILKAGGRAVMTRPDHPSGSDRIFEALTLVDPQGQHDLIINLQGDMPTFDPKLVGQLIGLMQEGVDIGTLASPITHAAERMNPAVVKPILSFHSETQARALYFTRATAPSGDGPLYHHIGIYAYRRQALERFVALPPSPLEQREKLEQLRALENHMRIDVTLVDTVPLGVDTPETLDEARRILHA